MKLPSGSCFFDGKVHRRVLTSFLKLKREVSTLPTSFLKHKKEVSTLLTSFLK
jgi:hypothetical protein